MITFCEFGTAPEQAKLGYKIQETFVGTEAEALAAFDDRDVVLVRGASVFGERGKMEFAVMTRTDCLWFRESSYAQRFMNAVKATGQEASIEVDGDDLNDPYIFGVTYSGHEVTEFSQTPYSDLGRLASRFKRDSERCTS